jgi:UDP-N-acetylglucosamine 2-epimerase (non-hydrolysing)
LGLKEKSYFVITLHRPSNVDSIKEVVEILNAIVKNARGLPVIFPIHPRTAKILKNLNINANNLFLVDPLSYLEFNFLIQRSKAVLTDSGGITEETTVLGIPCMTLRNNTERPETISTGTNELIGTSQKAITLSMERLFQGRWKKGSIPELWDGKSGLRIIEKLLTLS